MTQTKLYEGPGKRGSCVQACVASIFELPHDVAPEQFEIPQWTTANYPGLTFVHIDLHEPSGDAPQPVGHWGYWIAGVHTQTPEFVEDCGRCWEYVGNENGPGYARRKDGSAYDECPLCGPRFGLEPGKRRGYHAVVMKGARVVHDPHPNADWDADRVFVGASWWTVGDPSRLLARALPVRHR